ncbi:TetR/AcrR family transcriptional regulator [Streptomyces sp. CA-294286]|uniref:TetR/AcrR family transcriptional regulator n=1 Tax=Streptomyces sp. CA-294286 TaxID=3240070 RepID=UPI003D8C26DB
MDEVTQQPVSVWTRPERGARGPAAGHSRTELAAAAVALADREGLAAVSMRRVARELGVGQSSLYRYVAGRDDLLDLMTDRVAGETDLRVPLSGGPAEDLLGLAERTRAVLLRHRWLVDVPPEPLRLGPCGLAYLEYALRALAPTGLPGPVQLEVVAVMNALVAQFARTEQQGPASDAGRRAAQAAYLAGAAAGGEHPHLAAALAGQAGQADAARATAESSDGGEAVFRRTMRRVLDALVVPGGAH